MNRFLQDIRLGGQQVITPVEGGANFQWRNVNKGAWQSNGHLDIIKP
jgi:hypothetical protein